jgi:hypothetical protein
LTTEKSFWAQVKLFFKGIAFLLILSIMVIVANYFRKENIMSNMSYCRFQNTSTDFDDCVEYIHDNLSDDENRARRRLVEQAINMLNELGCDVQLPGDFDDVGVLIASQLQSPDDEEEES